MGSSQSQSRDTVHLILTANGRSVFKETDNRKVLGGLAKYLLKIKNALQNISANLSIKTPFLISF
jgi:hypothetical protein